MSSKDMTLIYYYVPEDRDDPEHPNANIRLSHIHDTFPLKGSYIYRFKYSNEGCPVWLDLPDVQSKLPTYKDRIVIKATRVSWGQSKLHSQYRDKQSIKAQSSAKAGNVNLFDNDNPSLYSKPSEAKQPIQQKANGRQYNILDQKPPQLNTAQPYPQFNLLDGPKHPNPPQGDIFFGAEKPKVQQINLMTGFQHGDLI